MKRVFLESPYAGDIARNLAYVRACMADCLARGEAPFASHALYTQCLRDDVPEERTLGMAAGETFRGACEATVVYIDFGISRGMRQGIDKALLMGHPIERRRLGGEWA
jgi:hypothetical protein